MTDKDVMIAAGPGHARELLQRGWEFENKSPYANVYGARMIRTTELESASDAYDRIWAIKTELESIIHELKAENKRLKETAE